MILSLEPSEALRVLKDYGNSDVKMITNMRPVRSIGVISGEQTYPEAKKHLQARILKGTVLDRT